MVTQEHKQRAHSKFSASGAERWMNCSGSVELSEGLPDKSSIYSIEGTTAHEVLEHVLHKAIKEKMPISRLGAEFDWKWQGPPNREMISHAISTAEFLLGLHENTPDSEFLVETRICLPFIHPDMFGTFDSAIVDVFGTLHVIDFKYGSGHAVSPKNNLQMAFYGLGLAHLYNWNFKRVRLWIIQPRIRGYDGPTYWEIPTLELKSYVDKFKTAVERVEKNPRSYSEGSWCHWCKAKAICPLKRTTKIEKAKSVFSSKPIGVLNGKEESKEKSSPKEKARTREVEIQARIEKAFGQSERGGEQDFF